MCRPSVYLEDLSATPRRITPDGNGVFDVSVLAGTVRIEAFGAGCGRCPEGDRTALVRLRASIKRGRGGGHGEALRDFEETVGLTSDVCQDDRCVVPFEFAWDGRDKHGRLLRSGEYTTVFFAAEVEALETPGFGMRRLGFARETGPTVEVSYAADARESAYGDVARIESAIGVSPRDPGDLPEDAPYRYDVAPRATLLALAEASARARGLDLVAEFDQRVARVRADPDNVVLPTAEQVEAWRRLFLDSHGSVEVEWSNAGTPEAVWGLDAGILAGTPEDVARAYLAAMDSDLRALFGMAPHESFVFERVVGGDGDHVVAGRFRHHVTGGVEDAVAGPVSLPVGGDYVLVHVRKAGLPGGTGRVLNLGARWSREVARPTAIIGAARAGEIAVGASGLPGGVASRVEDPILVVRRPGVREVVYDVFVTERDLVREVGVDGETGAVLWSRDGKRYAPNRLLANFNPATQETVFDFGEVISGLPTVRVCPPGVSGVGDAVLCIETDMAGGYDAGRLVGDPTAATARLMGQFYREYSLEIDRPEYTWHPRWSAVLDATAPSTYFRLPHLTAGEADWNTKEYLTRTMFVHLNYQAFLYHQVGLGQPQMRAQLFIDWGPRGTSYPCAADGDPAGAHGYCQDCSGIVVDTTRQCRSDVYDWVVCGGPGDAVCLRPDGAGNRRAFCDFSYGLCDIGRKHWAYSGWGGCYNATRGVRYGAVDPIDAATDRPDGTRPELHQDSGSCLHVDPEFFVCEYLGGCGGGGDFLERLSWAESYGLSTVTHENMHFADAFRPASPAVRGGTLAAFLTEAFSDLAWPTIYPHMPTWGNRDNSRPVDLAPTYLGDPVVGAVAGPTCRNPGEQDPVDDYVCPTRDFAGDATPTCDEGRCFELNRDAWADGCCGPATPGGCPAGVTPPGEMVCRNAKPYAPRDWHANMGWFQAAMLRYGVMVGREKAMRDMGALINSGIDESTTVSRGTWSLYHKLTTASRVLLPGKESEAEAFLAFDANVHGEAEVDPIDAESGLTHHGEFLPARYHRWRLGLLRGEGTLDGYYDSDTWNAYLFRGRTYEVSLYDTTGQDAWLSVTHDDAVEGRRLVPCSAGASPLTEVLIPRTAGGYGRASFVPPASGVYSFRVSGARYSTYGVARPYVLTVDMRDDLPDTADDAVRISQDERGVLFGTLHAGVPADVDVYSMYLTGGVGAARAMARFYVSSADRTRLRVTVRDPTGTVVGTCFGPGAVSAGCSIEMNPTRLFGTYVIDVRRVSVGGWTTLPYWFLLAAGSLEPACDGVLPPGADGKAPPGCELTPGPAFAGVAQALDRDNLWFHADAGQIVGITSWGSPTVAVHTPAYRNWFPAGSPGTGSQALLERSWDWPHQIAFVTPATGWYRVVVRPAGETPSPFQLRFFRSRYPECDFPNVIEATGGAVAPAPPPPAGW